MNCFLMLTMLFLSVYVVAQPVTQEKGKAQAKPTTERETIAPTNTEHEESKGEVDLLMDELKKQNNRVLVRCIENCESSEKLITGDVVVGQVIDKPQPAYPAIARAAHAFGEIVVQIVIDEEGKVIAAQAVSGNPLLRATSVKAAKESLFTPTLLEGKPVKVSGVITYKFVIQ
jgi:TonB family protein